jgi:hypothetical protein
LGGDGTVQSIPCYTAELVKWNEKVKNSLQKLSLPEEGDGNGFGQNDGTVLTAGFVSFNSLRSVQAALQMTHAEDPFTMEVLEAPDPEGRLSFRFIVQAPYKPFSNLGSFIRTIPHRYPVGEYRCKSSTSAVGRPVQLPFIVYPVLLLGAHYYFSSINVLSRIIEVYQVR